MKITFLTVLTALVLGALTHALATSYAEPKDRLVKSPNGKFALKIHAKEGLHELKSGDEVLWSFKRNVWHDEYFISNDGRQVLWVSDIYVSEEHADKNAALTVYSAEGVVLSRTSSDVSNPRPYRENEIGPVGKFWRIWRGAVVQDADVVTIQTVGEPAYVVDFSKLQAKD